jgi:hypothetical protein
MGNHVENILLGFSGNDEVIRIADIPINWGILPSGLSRCFPIFNLDLLSVFELVEELLSTGQKLQNIEELSHLVIQIQHDIADVVESIAK